MSIRSVRNVVCAATLASFAVVGAACVTGTDDSAGAYGANTESADEATPGTAVGELTGPTCQKAAGWFCGNDLMNNASANTVYKCTAAGAAPSTSQSCAAGCFIAPAGKNDYCFNQSTTPLKATSGNLAVLQGAAYDSSGYLPWSAASVLSAPSGYTPSQIPSSAYVTLGDGECVSLVKALTSTTSTVTTSWGKGVKVLPSGVAPGTAIATFDANGKYDSGHAAIFAGYNGGGIVVYDQNFVGGKGNHRAAKHTLPASGTGVNNANSYYVIKF